MSDINKKIELKVKLELRDMKQFNYYHNKKRIIWSAVMYFLIFNLVLIIMALNDMAPIDEILFKLGIAIPIGILAVTIIVGIYYLSIDYRSKKSFETDKLIQQEQQYTFTF